LSYVEELENGHDLEVFVLALEGLLLALLDQLVHIGFVGIVAQRTALEVSPTA
jgi:hypothetical protein